MEPSAFVDTYPALAMQSKLDEWFSLESPVETGTAANLWIVVDIPLFVYLGPLRLLMPSVPQGKRASQLRHDPGTSGRV